MTLIPVRLTAGVNWVPWWELVHPGEGLTITVTFAGTGEFGLRAGPSSAAWTLNRSTRSGRLTITLPATTGGLWRLGLFRVAGTATATVQITTASPTKATPTREGSTVPLYRLTTQRGDLPAGTIVQRRGQPIGAFGPRRLQHPFWTTKLAANAAVASTSTDYVDRMVKQFNAVPGATPLEGFYPKASNTTTSTGAYSIPVYEVPTDTPRVPVWSKADKYYLDGSTRVNLRDQLQAVPLPDLSQLIDGRIQPSGTDGSVIVICGWQMLEFWGFEPATSTTPAGYAWQCKQGGYIADTRYHPGWWSGSGTGNLPRGGDFGVSAAGCSYLGPILTGHDWNSPDIDHPLAVALPLTGGTPERIRPATRNDVNSALKTPSPVVDAYRLPEGTRFRLPASWTDVVIDTYAAAHGDSRPAEGSTAAVLAKILRAVRDYGILVVDFAGVIGFSAEASKTFGTPYNPYTTAQTPTWGNFGQQIPWADLLQVAPPAVGFSALGAGPTTPQPAEFDFTMAAA